MTPRLRAGRRYVPVLVAVPLVLLLVIAAFPYGVLKGVVADRLAKRFGRPVVIGAMDRVDAIGFTPTIRVRDVTIPQAGWAGTGNFLTLREARVTFPVWPLLTGTFRPRDIVADGLQLALVRDANGRTNWSRPGEAESGGASSDLKGLTIRDATIRYRDDKRRRSAVVQVSSDAQGLRAKGNGTIRGVPVRIALDGASVAQPSPGPWPFTATIDGDRLSMRAKGSTDVPLDTDAMTLDVTARAADLRLIDAVIEAGLFGTQPVALTAHVRHDAPKWIVNDLKGTIGQSDIAGHVTVDKQDGRTKLDGAVTANRFDFGDLASDEGRAEAAARERAIGPHVVPDTRIDLSKIGENRRPHIAPHRARGQPQRTDAGARAVDGLGARPQAARRCTADAGARRWHCQGQPARRPARRRAQPAADGRYAAERHARCGAARHRRRLHRADRSARASDRAGRYDPRGGGAVRRPHRFRGARRHAAAALRRGAGLRCRTRAAGGESERARLRCVVVGLKVTDGLGHAAPMIVDTSASQLRGTGTVLSRRTARHAADRCPQGRRPAPPARRRLPHRHAERARDRRAGAGQIGRQRVEGAGPRDHRQAGTARGRCRLRGAVGTRAGLMTIPLAPSARHR